jgi:hypothetical protein
MHHHAAAVQLEKQVFSATADARNPPAVEVHCEILCRAPCASARGRTDRNGVQNAGAADRAPLDKRAQRLRNGFDFGQLGHLQVAC